MSFGANSLARTMALYVSVSLTVCLCVSRSMMNTNTIKRNVFNFTNQQFPLNGCSKEGLTVWKSLKKKRKKRTHNPLQTKHNHFPFPPYLCQHLCVCMCVCLHPHHHLSVSIQKKKKKLKTGNPFEIQFKNTNKKNHQLLLLLLLLFTVDECCWCV